ncbi:MAG: rRNA maturation RNase YbeY [Candidatus Dormibacteria bacterium]
MTVVFAGGLSRGDRELAREASLEALLKGAVGDLSLGNVSLNCRLATPTEIRRLNRDFAHSDQATDVLAFPAESGAESQFRVPPADEKFLGDIVISVTTAKTQAELAGNDPQAEVRLLAVHGLLHLLGHDHEEATAAARMTGVTRSLLDLHAGRLGMAAPSVPRLQSRA